MITLLNKFDDNYVMKENDLLEVVYHYIVENELELFIRDVNFNDKLDDIARYSDSKNIIEINMQRLMEVCTMWSNKLQKTYHIDDKYYTYLENYYLLFSLFHEISHASQKKQHDFLGLTTNKVFMFLYELNEKLQYDNSDLYNRCHDLFPMEIDANNTGLLRSYNLMSHTKLPNREKKIMHLQYVNSLLANYEKINKYRIKSPFSKLYNEENRINMNLFNKLLNEAKLSKIERLNLGIDITPHEYNGL